MENSSVSTEKAKYGSLRRALLLSVASTILIPLLLLAMGILFHLSSRATVNATSHNQLLARAISGQIEVFLQTPRSTLASLRDLQLNQRNNLSPETFQKLLHSLTESSGLVESIYLLNRKGLVTDVGLPFPDDALNDELTLVDLGHVDFIKQAWKNNAPVWSDTFLSLITGRTNLSLAVPAGDRMIVGNINIDQINNFLRRLHLGGNIETTVVDRRGEIIACSHKIPKMSPTNLWSLPLVRNVSQHNEKTSTYIFNGENYLGSVAKIKGTGWLTLVTQTSADAYQPGHRTSFFFLSIFLLTFIIVIFVVIVISKKISDPLYLFAYQARMLATGNYSTPKLTPGYSEIATLSEAFQHMTEQISEREASLKQSEEAYRTLAENLPAIAYRLHVHAGNHVQFMNDEYRSMTGYKTDDFSTSAYCPFENYVHPDDYKSFVSTIKGAIAGHMPFAQEYRFRHANGEYRSFFEKASPVYDSQGEITHIDGVIFDVTDRKRTEEIILQSEKMLTVGGLAAGMAHEINNPLAGILQNCQLIVQRLDENLDKNIEIARQTGVDLGKVRDYLKQRRIPGMLEAIRDSGQRAARIVENILDFSRKRREDFTLQDMTQLIDKALELARSDFDLHKDFDFRSIKIDCHHEDALPLVYCEPTQIQQVLLNIFKNGSQAMNEEDSAKSPCFKIRTFAQDGMVGIEISDNGPGIPKSIQKRIFEPFFTTKGIGKGTGLGLSVCYFIITEKHQGSMTVSSTSGVGSAFTICLPRKTTSEKV